MIIKEKNQIFFSKQKLSNEDINTLNIPSSFPGMNRNLLDNTTKINNKYFYYKQLDKYSVIKELIGSYLSETIELDSVDYKIGIEKEKKQLYALSEIFYDSNYFYYYPNRIINIQNKNLKKYVPFTWIKDIPLQHIDNKNLLENIYKLISVDLKMGQFDRNHTNLMIRVSKSDNSIDLAPIYDFDLSYILKKDTHDFYEFYKYENPFVSIRRNSMGIYLFMRKYPETIRYIEKLYNLDMETILNDIEKIHGLKFNDNEKELFIKCDTELNKVLKKSLMM